MARGGSAFRHGPPNRSGKETLRRGVPYVDEVAWDRHRGRDGASALPGTYAAALKGGAADELVFRLR